MNMQQEDYTSELITKWSLTGHLVGVQELDQVKVAQRLEAAYRRSMGPRGDIHAINREMEALRREGFYRPVNSEGGRRKIRG